MDGQLWRAARYGRHGRFVADLALPLIDLLRPRPGERILDLGCGDGAMTARLAAAGAEVVAIDASPDMVAAARARGLDARVMDGQKLAFEREFDAVFSNAALHWMPDADAVLAGIARALRPGGRLVAEMGAGANVAAIRDALEQVFHRHGVDAAARFPWYFPSFGDYRAKLARHGFAVGPIELFARPTPFDGPLADWLETFTAGLLALLPAGDRAAAIAEIAEHLRPRLYDTNDRWVLDYVRLRFAAVLEGR